MKPSRLKITFFKNYEETQKEKMKFIAVNSRGTVLDIGGSQNPNYYFDFIDKVKEVYLVDIIKPLKPLPKKYTKFFDFDLNEVGKKSLPFDDNTFDTVVAADVIEHLDHTPLPLLLEIKRILKSKGMLIISVPTPKYYVELLHTLLFGKPMGFPEHKLLYTRCQMKYFLELVEFRIIRIVGYSFWIPFLKLGFMNTKFTLPEFITWQQIYISIKE
ncbi:MAG: hypothetical protein DRN04_16540 [Thermoprotei archaeon]|nr:MAG: hypothetical protein DRN04_16540 [Thermoprotei archaeon]